MTESGKPRQDSDSRAREPDPDRAGEPEPEPEPAEIDLGAVLRPRPTILEESALVPEPTAGDVDVLVVVADVPYWAEESAVGCRQPEGVLVAGTRVTVLTELVVIDGVEWSRVTIAEGSTAVVRRTALGTPRTRGT